MTEETIIRLEVELSAADAALADVLIRGHSRMPDALYGHLKRAKAIVHRARLSLAEEAPIGCWDAPWRDEHATGDGQKNPLSWPEKGPNTGGVGGIVDGSAAEPGQN